MALQVQLRALGRDLPLDGRFGALTSKAVLGFQRDHGLRADGVVGAATWRLLLVRTRG
jgi:peptidoglycan hydrolase-like protein with peptidoglycan-binding domain